MGCSPNAPLRVSIRPFFPTEPLSLAAPALFIGKLVGQQFEPVNG